MTLAVDLVAARLNRGLSIRAAAKDIGVNKETLGAAERGESRPQPSIAKLIADFYGYKVTDIWPVPDEEPTAA